MLIILQHSGFENAQLVQLLLYAALKLLQMLFDWFCELLRLAVLHPQLCHELQICALPRGQFTLHRVYIFLQEVHQLAQWVGSPCQSLYRATQTIDLTASQLPFPTASCLPLLMPQE